jgi:hypothetical protein
MSSAKNRDRLYFATRSVQVSRWSAEFRNDELADISYNGTPVLRAVRAVVRDQDWRTLDPTVRGFVQNEDENGTRFTCALEFEGFGCHYTGELSVHFSADTLQVAFNGLATDEFLSNRIGLVVLHRPDDSGTRVIIESPTGLTTESRFPTEISAHQPFTDVAAMKWERNGLDLRLDFAGDVFETEDQRNWTDASFKTYSTPLSKPFPVHVATGSRVQQSVTLTARTADRQGTRSDSGAQREPLTVHYSQAGTVPALSISASMGEDCTSATAKPMPGLNALLVEVLPGQRAQRQLASATRQAAIMGIPLDVRLVVEKSEQIPDLVRMLPMQDIVRLTVFDAASHVTEPALWDALLLEAKRYGYTGDLIAGARSHFTELNRNFERLPSEAAALTYSSTPQMHATEVPHIVESLPMQRKTAANALRLAEGGPIHVGPITLKPRFNAVATTSGTEEREAPQSDELQTDPFTAAWLLGSVNALTWEGVNSLSYFEVSGPGGIIQDGGLTPAGEILSVLASLRGRPVQRVSGNRPGLVVYPVQDGAGLVTMAANLTRYPMETKIELPNGSTIDLDIAPWAFVIERSAIEGETP